MKFEESQAANRRARLLLSSAESACMRSDFARLLEAIDFAAKKHRNQRRKDHDASPYINHPLGLAALLAKEGGVDDVEVLQATVGNQGVIGPWRGEPQVCAGQRPVAI